METAKFRHKFATFWWLAVLELSVRDDVRKILTEQPAKPTAREVLWSVIEAMPLGERLDPLQKELIWVFGGKQKPEEHEFILPAYCYDIFAPSRSRLPQKRGGRCLIEQNGRHSSRPDRFSHSWLF
jgi:hypothetical protein